MTRTEQIRQTLWFLYWEESNEFGPRRYIPHNSKLWLYSSFSPDPAKLNELSAYCCQRECRCGHACAAHVPLHDKPEPPAYLCCVPGCDCECFQDKENP